MNIVLYSSSAENSRINKLSYLTQQRVLSGTLREATSIITPSVVVQSNGLPQGNYAYIEDFNRYYFITNITSVNLNLWRIDMRCDVLMSHKDELLNLYAYVSRYQYSEETEFIDKVRPVKSVPIIQNLYYWDAEWANYKNNELSGKWAIIIAVGTYTDDELAKIPNEYYPVDKIYDRTGFGYPLSDGMGRNNSLSYTIKAYAFPLHDNGFNATFKNVTDKISTDSNFMSMIINIYYCPGAAFQIKGGAKTDQIIIGKFQEIPSVIDGDVYILSPYIFNGYTFDYDITPEINDGKDNYTPYVDSIYKCSPYYTYYLKIPFYGNVEIDSKFIYKRRLLMRIVLDFTTGQANFGIYSTEKPYGDTHAQLTALDLVVSDQFEFLSPFTLTSDGSAVVDRQRSYNQMVKSISETSAGWKAAGGMMDSFGSIVGGILNPISGAVGIAKGMTGTASSGIELLGSLQVASMQYEANEILNIPVGTKALTNSQLATYILDQTKIYLWIKGVDRAMDDEDFARLCGLPYNKYVQLNGLNGFAIVSDIHLENLPSCLEDEKTELHTLLRQGCIYESTAS